MEWSPDKPIFPHCPLGLLPAGFGGKGGTTWGWVERGHGDRFPHLSQALYPYHSRKKRLKKCFLYTRKKLSNISSACHHVLVFFNKTSLLTVRLVGRKRCTQPTVSWGNSFLNHSYGALRCQRRKLRKLSSKYIWTSIFQNCFLYSVCCFLFPVWMSVHITEGSW